MINETESIVQGETFRIGVSIKISEEDAGLVDANLVVFNENNVVIIENTAPFIESETIPLLQQSDLSTTDTDIEPGTYNYFVRINWDDDTNDVVPDSECIESGECEYMKLIICEKPSVNIVS